MVMPKLIDFIIHIDKYIEIIIANYGIFTYFILFFIVFIETGLVIAPFLPGDSLIFVAGAFAARGAMNVYLLFFLLCIAAILGDTVNYWIGSYFGKNVFSNSRFFKKEHLKRTEEFYDKYGSKTIIIARFVPIVRTFAPFVAGVGKMKYSKFITYNITGGIAWVLVFLFAGYFFGTIPFVEKNLTLFIFAIIFISLLPPVVEYIRQKRRN